VNTVLFEFMTLQCQHDKRENVTETPTRFSAVRREIFEGVFRFPLRASLVRLAAFPSRFAGFPEIFTDKMSRSLNNYHHSEAAYTLRLVVSRKKIISLYTHSLSNLEQWWRWQLKMPKDSFTYFLLLSFFLSLSPLFLILVWTFRFRLINVVDEFSNIAGEVPSFLLLLLFFFLPSWI